MTRRRKLLLGLLMVGLLAPLPLLFVPKNPEPVYKGRKLSEWVWVFATTKEVVQTEAEDAIRAIGTNGIPFYVQWVTYNPNLIKGIQLEVGAKSASGAPPVCRKKTGGPSALGWPAGHWDDLVNAQHQPFPSSLPAL
jgi:hypothetical protein